MILSSSFNWMKHHDLGEITCVCRGDVKRSKNNSPRDVLGTSERLLFVYVSSLREYFTGKLNTDKGFELEHSGDSLHH